LLLGTELPRKKSLNWTIPELVNNKVGSFFRTIGADGTIWCPFFLKNSRNVLRMVEESIKVKKGTPVNAQKNPLGSCERAKLTRSNSLTKESHWKMMPCSVE